MLPPSDYSRPNICRSLLGVADSYAALPPKEAFPAVKEKTMRALEMDDGLAEAHATLGFINFYNDWNGVDAANQFRRALADNPNYAMAHSWCGESLAAMGVGIRKRLRSIGGNAGWTLSLAGKGDQAIEILEKSDRDRSQLPAQRIIGWAEPTSKRSRTKWRSLNFEQAVSLS
jgi:hypothetical protein